MDDIKRIIEDCYPGIEPGQLEEVCNGSQNLRKNIALLLDFVLEIRKRLVKNRPIEDIKECFKYADIVCNALQNRFEELIVVMAVNAVKNKDSRKEEEAIEIIQATKARYDDIREAFMKMLKKQEEADKEADKSEIKKLVKLTDTSMSVLCDNPIIKSMTRQNVSKASYGRMGNIELVKHRGGLTPYHAEVFNTALKAYREGKVTKDGYIVITENSAIKSMLGTTGTPSKGQRADYRQAWEDMRNEYFSYKTTETLAEILHIEQKDLERFINGLEEQDGKLVDDYFIQGLQVIRDVKVYGNPTNIYLVKPCEVVRKCIDCFQWYELIEPSTQRIMQINGDGELEPWKYSKQRIEMRNYIYSWVMKYRRTMTAELTTSTGRKHSNLLPYENIFAECGIALNSRVQKKRRIDDVRTILEHLKREEVIADWKEYEDKTGNVRGAQIILYKEVLE